MKSARSYTDGVSAYKFNIMCKKKNQFLLQK